MHTSATQHRVKTTSHQYVGLRGSHHPDVLDAFLAQLAGGTGDQ